MWNRQQPGALPGVIAGVLGCAPDTRSAKLTTSAFLVVIGTIHLPHAWEPPSTTRQPLLLAYSRAAAISFFGWTLRRSDGQYENARLSHRSCQATTTLAGRGAAVCSSEKARTRRASGVVTPACWPASLPQPLSQPVNSCLALLICVQYS